MILWVDAQLPPGLASWLTDNFDVEAFAVRDVGLLRHNEPYPQVIWITCGNTSNQRLEQILARTLPAALKLLAQGEPLVEISDAQ